jgi:hypothetical protein
MSSSEPGPTTLTGHSTRRRTGVPRQRLSARTIAFITLTYATAVGLFILLLGGLLPAS